MLKVQVLIYLVSAAVLLIINWTFIKGQLGFKLPALLSARTRTDPQATEVLFGDDVEADALVYALYADVVAGLVGAAELAVLPRRSRGSLHVCRS